MAPHKIVTYFFSGKAIDHGTEISPERFTRMIFTIPRNCPNFKYPHDLIFKIHDIIPELSMTHSFRHTFANFIVMIGNMHWNLKLTLFRSIP